MPKMKTHSSAKKRFKVTGTGKVLHWRANRSHLMRKKSKKAKTRLRGSVVMDITMQARAKRMLCLL